MSSRDIADQNFVRMIWTSLCASEAGSIIELPDNRGWRHFQHCCEVICGSWPEATQSSILAAHREGLTGPHAVRLFVHAFEAAIDVSRDPKNWELLSTSLLEAEAQLNMIFPGPGLLRGAAIDPSKSEVHARGTFDAFARCHAHAIAQSKSVPADPRILAREYERCRAAWESENLAFDIIAPVCAVCTTGFDRTQINEIFDLAFDHVALSEAAIHHLDYCGASPFRQRPHSVLIGRVSVKKSGSLDGPLTQAIVDAIRCITAMRLATGKPVGCDMVHVIPSKEFFQIFNAVPHNVEFVGVTTIYGERHILGTPLTDSEIAETARIARFLAGEPGRQLSTAIHRFNWAIGRPTLEDQVIDLAIALESTLCRGNVREQLSYRFRLFGAAVLAEVVGWERAFMMLRGLYNARSSIVHGGKRLAQIAKEDDMQQVFASRSIDEFAGECRDLARRIILDFLNQAANGRGPDAYVHSLQETMLRTAKRSLDSADE